MPPERTRSIADALRVASKDADFARDFVTHPEDYRAIYRLSDAQVSEIKRTTVADLVNALPGGGVGPNAADYY